MITHRCKNCRWWDNREQFIEGFPDIEWKPNPGLCRRRRAGAIKIKNLFIGIHPVMDAEEFCGEFKGDK